MEARLEQCWQRGVAMKVFLWQHDHGEGAPEHYSSKASSMLLHLLFVVL